MRVVVPGGEGASCVSRTLAALEREGLRASTVATGATRLPRCDAVVLAGAPGSLLAALRRAAARGLPILASGDAFAALCEMGLLPGRLLPATQELVCRLVHLRVEGRPTPFTGAVPAGRVLRLPLVSTASRYTVTNPDELAAQGRVLLRYCDAAGGIAPAADPTGSDAAIAAVCNEAGNVVGVTPSLDGDLFLGGQGRQFLTSLRLHLERRRE